MRHVVPIAALAICSLASCSDDATSDAGATGSKDAGGDVQLDDAQTDANEDVGSDQDASPDDADTSDGPVGPDVGSDAQPDAAPDAGCADLCPTPGGGVTWGCQKRFMYGVNYAWNHFAGDFGGISSWGQSGVAAESQLHLQQLTEMREHGANVVRWWVFPDFRGDGVTFDGAETPTGLGATTVADVQAALAVAEQADVYLMLCLFSFDNFRPSADVSGLWTPGLEPIVVDGTKRQALLEQVVRPFAAAVEASPHRHRMIAWDVINEPEWAMTGPSPYGDQAYDPGSGIDPVDHPTMEGFVSDVIGVLRQESSALVTVGSAAFKWAHAWTGVDLDFYQFHMYAWINTYWPYTDPPSVYGLDAKPIVMGEFPMGDLASDSYADVVSSWHANGFAGALSWQYNEATAAGLNDVKTFADQHACETRYTTGPGAGRMGQNGAVLTHPHPSEPGRLCRVVDGRAVCE